MRIIARANTRTQRFGRILKKRSKEKGTEYTTGQYHLCIGAVSYPIIVEMTMESLFAL